MKPGRNDPCPCGSGKKYKKCCLEVGETEDAAWREARITSDLTAEALQRFVGIGQSTADDLLGPALEKVGVGKGSSIRETELPLLFNVALHEIPAKDGRTIGRLLLESKILLDARVRQHLEAHAREPFSFYEVRSVEPGRGIVVEDLLRGDQHEVTERAGSRTMLPRYVLFGKLIPEEKLTMFDGMGSLPILAGARDGLLKDARKLLGAARRERFDSQELKAHTIELLHLYQRAGAAAQTPAPLPELQNTDGDPLELIETAYRFPAPHRDALLNYLEKIPGMRADAERDGVIEVHWGRESTSLGVLHLAASELRTQTNSRARERGLSRLLQAGLVRLEQVSSKSTDPLTELQKPRLVQPPPPSGLSPGEEAEVVAAMLERHYSTWADVPLPALRGKTPRQAAKTRAGAKEVDALLREMEMMQARSAMPATFDFDRIRRDLGLPSG